MYLRPRLSQNVAVGSTSQAAAAVPAACTHVRLAATNDCYVFFSSNGTAKTAVADGTGLLVRASTAGETFKCSPGDIISAIQVSAAGVLNVSFMTN